MSIDTPAVRLFCKMQGFKVGPFAAPPVPSTGRPASASDWIDSMATSDLVNRDSPATPRIAAWIKCLWRFRHVKVRQLIARPGDRDLTKHDVYLAGRDERPYSLARARANQAALLARQAVAVETPRGTLRFANFGRQSTNRAASLLTKEPGTIAWIDAMPRDAVLWDVGANIGIYSLYAAKRGLRVVAIEPAAVNHWLLCANIELNDLCDIIMAVPCGLENRDGFEPLLASQFQAAKAPGFRRRKPYVPAHVRQNAAILKGSTLLSLGAPFPNHIKIDVLAVTAQVLDGLSPLLDDPRLQSIQIEVGHGAKGRRHCIARLAPHGLHPLPECQQQAGHGSANLIFCRGC